MNNNAADFANTWTASSFDSSGPEVLEPCSKPQAEEAWRLLDSDDACDDGVR
jgi:hypothetical protein